MPLKKKPSQTEVNQLSKASGKPADIGGLFSLGTLI